MLATVFQCQQIFVKRQNPKVPSRSYYLIKSHCKPSRRYYKVTQCSCVLVKLTNLHSTLLCANLQLPSASTKSGTSKKWVEPLTLNES